MPAVQYTPESSGPSTRMSGQNVSGGYESKTKAELEDELESRGLPKTGNKDELIARLQEADAGA